MPNDSDNFNPQGMDRTIILPTPGGNKPNGAASHSSSFTPHNQHAPNSPFSGGASQGSLNLPRIESSSSSDDNPVVGNSLAIISYAAQLRQIPEAPDANKLFQEMIAEIKNIGDRLRQAGHADDVVISSRYLICSFIDEMVLNTPWGSTSNWSTHSLLSYFHKESQGGTKFFEILQKLEQQSARYIALIELAYVCLSYGYLGKYRLAPDGHSQIEKIKENLYRHIVHFKQNQQANLSSVQNGLDVGSSPLSKGKALLVTGIVAIISLIVVFVTLLVNLNEASDPINRQAWELKTDLPTMIQKPRAVKTGPDISAILATLSADQNAGTIAVSDINGGYKFTLFGQGLFGSGSAVIANTELVSRVASVLSQIPGPIQVIGHSDDIPIRTVEFPSNMHLSKARAQAIADAVLVGSDSRHVEVTGMADLDPLLPNTNSANRAKNRRVEILLFSN